MRNKIKQGIRMLFVLAGITYMASGCGFAEQAELLKNELSKAGIESGKPKEPQKKKKKQKKSEKKTPAKCGICGTISEKGRRSCLCR